MRRWRKPCAERSAAIERSRSGSLPSTETKTRAWRRSGDVSTAVTVTKPTRGSLSSCVIAPDKTSRTASSTRRMRPPLILVTPSHPTRPAAARRARPAGSARRGSARRRRRHPRRAPGSRPPAPRPASSAATCPGGRPRPPRHRDAVADAPSRGSAPLASPSGNRTRERRDGPAEGRRRSAPPLGEGALDLPGRVDLDHVAFLDVHVVLEDHAALEARLHLAHVVVEAPQRGDLAVIDDRAVAHQPALGAAGGVPVGDHAAGDDADLGGAEDLPDLERADGLLDLFRREHALHGVAQLVDRAVDDRVGADLDALALSQLARLAHRADVEAEDDRVGRGGEVDVGLRDAADAGVDDLNGDLVLRQLGDLVLEGLERARHVGLEHEPELVDQGAALAVEDVLERELLAAAAGERLGLDARGPLTRELARLAVVLDHADELAGLGDGVEAEDLDRLAGPGLLDLVSLVVVHRAHAAPVGAGHDVVADLERAALDEDRHDGTAAGVELGLDDHAGGVRVRVGLELLDLGHQDDRLEQVVEVLLRLGRHVDEQRLPAPLFGLQAEVRHLRADAVGLRALLVDLVDRDEDRHPGRLRVVDRLAGLRHHAVVGRDDDDRDVGDLGAAGAHGGERLVAGRVEEGDDLVADVDLVGADVLGDAAGLACDDVGLAHGVEQRCLAVVDVAHDRDHRRALDEVVGGVLELRLLVDVVGRVDDLDLLVELVGEDLDRVVGQRLGQRGHLAQLHQLLDHLGDRHAEVLRDVLDRRAGVDADGVGLERALVLRRRLDVGATAPAAAAARRAALGAGRAAAGAALAARGLRIDHDAAHAAAAGAGGALALQRGARRPLARLVAVGGRVRAGAVGALGGRRLRGGPLRLLLLQLRAARERAGRGVLLDRPGGRPYP